MAKSDEVFQARVDELLLMEKRIDKKVQQLTEYNNKLQTRINETINNVDNSANRFEQQIAHKLDRLVKLNDITHHGAISLADASKRWMVIFMLFAVIILLFTGGATWRLNYLLRQIDIANNMLATLDVKLSKTPEVVQWAGRDYIKIVKYSEMNFNEAKTKAEKEKWGAYAEVWYPKRP